MTIFTIAWMVLFIAGIAIVSGFLVVFFFVDGIVEAVCAVRNDVEKGNQ